MKALSIPQPYTFLMAASAEYELPRGYSTDYRGKVLLCAGNECLAPVLEGIITNAAVCVSELVDVSPISEEDQKESGVSAQYVWKFAKPKLIMPFEVPEQDGFFDVPADIEYIGSLSQFREGYKPYVTDDLSVDVINLYAYMQENYFADELKEIQ